MPQNRYGTVAECPGTVMGPLPDAPEPLPDAPEPLWTCRMPQNRPDAPAPVWTADGGTST